MLVCLQRNCREKLASTEGQATALPPWVDKAIDVRFSKSEDSDVMTLSHSSNGGPSRSYSIRNEGSTLYVLSNDFEGLWFELPYATEQKPVQAFQRKFTELDQEVSAILMESVDISGVTESDAGDSVSGELPSDDEARVYKRKKAGAASAIIEQGPSARDVRMIRAAGINRVSQAAFCFPVQASIGGEDFTLKELLDPDEYIFPTVSGAKVAQTTLRMLQAKANEIKALVGEIAVSITASEEVNGKSLNNRISEYVGLLRLLPQIREDMDNSTSGYVYVSNSEKYTAALSLENVPDTLINVMQAAKRHAVSAAERSDPHGFGRLV